MKKITCLVGILVFSLMMFVTAHAGWKKYDDFSSGSVDPARWSTTHCSSAFISVENGKLRIDHQPNNPNISCWLIPIIKTNKIKGLKATITFDSCNFQNVFQDVRGRIGSWLGTDGGNPDYVFGLDLGLGPYFQDEANPKLYGELYRIDYANNYSLINNPFFGEFFYTPGVLPADVMGTPYTVAIEWTKKQAIYTVQGQGAITYTWGNALNIQKITDPKKVFVAIGTNSASGAGVCTIYFDDVYVK